jgi:uncharacterized damage-inducible protein DinB
MSPQPEFWLRGPIEGVEPVLMPAAHAFLQTLEDAEHWTSGLTDDQIWRTPNGAASIGFHLMHLSGATDRLLTYARGSVLDAAQKAALSAEKDPPRASRETLLAELRRTIEAALAQIRTTPPATVFDVRTVGRAALPTTVIGLLFHAAEHSQRHAGQIVTTSKLVRDAGGG